MKIGLIVLNKGKKMAVFNNVIYTHVPKKYKSINNLAIFTVCDGGFIVAETKEQMYRYPDFMILYMLDSNLSKIGYIDGNHIEYISLQEFKHNHRDNMLKNIKAGSMVSFGCSAYVALGKVFSIDENQIVIQACKPRNKVVVNISNIEMITRNVSQFRNHDTIDIFCNCKKEDFFKEAI